MPLTQKILYGAVNADGSIKEGTGFTARKSDENLGVYTIEFDVEFNSMPVVVVTQNWKDWDDPQFFTGSTFDNAVIISISRRSTLIKTGNNEGNGENRNFCFIAIGEINA